MAGDRRLRLSNDEIRAAFTSEPPSAFPPILDVPQAATLLRVPRKTLYLWIAQGRLDGAFRKRGRRHLLWRDRLIDVLLNGPAWEPEEEENDG